MAAVEPRRKEPQSSGAPVFGQCRSGMLSRCRDFLPVPPLGEAGKLIVTFIGLTDTHHSSSLPRLAPGRPLTGGTNGAALPPAFGCQADCPGRTLFSPTAPSGDPRPHPRPAHLPSGCFTIPVLQAAHTSLSAHGFASHLKGGNEGM